MDPQQQHAANALAGLGVGLILFGFLLVFAFVAFFIFLHWRIFTKAGLAGPLALLLLVPGVGWLIVPCILAFSDWPVAPVAVAPYYPPVYPPPPVPTAPLPPSPTDL
jgi:hypothetical protein